MWVVEEETAVQGWATAAPGTTNAVTVSDISSHKEVIRFHQQYQNMPPHDVSALPLLPFILSTSHGSR